MVGMPEWRVGADLLRSGRQQIVSYLSKLSAKVSFSLESRKFKYSENQHLRAEDLWEYGCQAIGDC